MGRLFIIFYFISHSLTAQFDKQQCLIFIDLQGQDKVINQYYLYLDKDTIEHHVEQSNNDYTKKIRIDPSVSKKLADLAISSIERVKIDSTKELNLYPSHFFRITVSFNQQQKTIFIQDKYYYLLLEKLFSTINKSVGPTIQLPLKSITFAKRVFSSSDKTTHNSFCADWRHSFFSNNPKNRTIYYNSDYKDSLRVTIGADRDRKTLAGNEILDSLWILTSACVNQFKFNTDPTAKPKDYEFFEVYQHTKRVEVMTTFRSFDLANKNQHFIDLRNYINKHVLPTDRLE